MEYLAYSFHLGNDKNKTKRARQLARDSKTGTTSFSNNAIQNIKDLSKADKHNLRKYDNNPELIKIIAGTNSITKDIKRLYYTEFIAAQNEYNAKQTREDRKIKNYYQHVSDNSKSDLACEIIVELGDMEFWQNKDEDYKQKMTEVFKEQLTDLNRIVHSFKIGNAVIHYDEASPHLHIVGVPVKAGGKNGMNKQVGKTDIFTKESLKKIQDEMRICCINSFNREYDNNYILKTKEKGRNKDINVKDMGNYAELKKQAETNKKRLEQANVKTDELNNKSTEVSKILDELKPTLVNKDNFTISKDKIDNIKSFVAKVEDTAGAIKNVNDLTVLMNNVENDLKDHAAEVQELKHEIIAKDEMIKDLNSLVEKKDDEITEQNNKIFSLEQSVKYLKDKFKKIIEFFREKLFTGKDSKNFYYDVIIKDLKDNDIIEQDDYNYIQKGSKKAKEKDDFER